MPDVARRYDNKPQGARTLQIVRTILWVLLLFGILVFSFLNWDPVEVALWDNLVLETKIPALVIVSFLLGLIPMWLYHRSVKWSLKRRIRSLENSIKSTALTQARDLPEGPAPLPGDHSEPTDEPMEPAFEKPEPGSPAPAPSLAPSAATPAAGPDPVVHRS